LIVSGGGAADDTGAEKAMTAGIRRTIDVMKAC
jgi:hypothetical protein